MSEWKPMDSAPKDGTWFLVLRPVTIVGGGHPSRANPELDTVRRHRTSPESDGYWQSIYFHSIADSNLARAYWAPLDALPLVEIWTAIENERIRQGGLPMPLPMPLPLCADPRQTSVHNASETS